MNDESNLNIETNTEPQEIQLTEDQKRKQSYDDFRKEWEKAAKSDVANLGLNPKEYGFDAEVPDDKPNMADLSKTINNEPQTEVTETPVDSNDDEDEEIHHGPIPKKRFNKEIEKRKALEVELARERESRIKFETELTLYNKALDELNKKSEPKQEAIQPIDEEAHNLYMKRIQDLESKIENQTKSISQRDVQKQFEESLNYQQEQFQKNVPDFADAYQHVIKAEMESYKMAGYSEQEAAQLTQQQLASRAWNSFNNGKNVAEVFYNMAKTYGYNSKAQNTIKTVSNTPNLERIEKNMRKSETILNDIPEVSTKFAPETESYLSPDGFNRLMNKDGRGVNKNEFHKILNKLRSGV